METSLKVRSQAEVTKHEGDDVIVIARNPQEMAQAQASLVEWAEKKVEYCKGILTEAEENLEHAKTNHLRTSGWKSQLRRSRVQVSYYEKIRDALISGYCIVPNFPGSAIAVRTESKTPSSKVYDGDNWAIPSLKSGKLPSGRGEYKSPNLETYSFEESVTTSSGNTLSKKFSQATNVMEVDFPFKMVRPQILQELTRAMQEKIFDEISVLPAVNKGDPMIIGHVHGIGSKRTSFLITWWIDSKDL